VVPNFNTGEKNLVIYQISKLATSFIQDPKIDKATTIAAFIIGGMGIYYLFSRSILIGWKDVDFLHVWLSGHLWSQGISPYSPEYIERGSSLFDPFNRQAFFYPPSFWFISRFFAQFDYQFAVELWRWTSFGLIFLSSFLLRSALHQAGVKVSFSTMVFYTGLVSMMQSMILTFVLGQTSILIYFAVCLVIYSVLSKNNILLAAGLCLVLLKPTLGAGIFIGLLPFKIYRKSIIMTCLGTILISSPALLPFGPIATIKAYLKGTSGHGDFIANHPELTTGFRNIFFHITDISLSSTLALLITIFGMLITLIIIKNKGLNPTDDESSIAQIYILILCLSIIGALAPLHTYDFMFIAPIILLTLKSDKYIQMIVFILFLVIARAQNISIETGIFYPPDLNLWGGSELSTISAFAMSIIAYISAKRYLKKIKV